MTDASNAPMTAAHATYWRQGAQIVQACLDKAAKADPLDAPMPMTAAEAAIWHRAQVEAYRHALEMMAPPEEASEALIERTNESVAKLLEEGSDARSRGAVGKLVGQAADGRDIRVHTSQGASWSELLDRTIKDDSVTYPSQEAWDKAGKLGGSEGAA